MPRAIFLVGVDLDPVPGAFHTEESARTSIQQILRDRINHYNPSVQPISEESILETAQALRIDLFELGDHEAVNPDGSYPFAGNDQRPR